MNIKTSIAYHTLFKHRLAAIDAYADRFQSIQMHQLCYILDRAKHTLVGRRYGLSSATSYHEFARTVPAHTYEGLKDMVSMMIDGQKSVLVPGACNWYAKSSGTTNDKSKFIPVPYNYLRRNHYLGASDVLSLYLRNRPDSQFFKTKGLLLGGSHSPAPLNKNAHVGDLSALLVQHMPLVGDLIRVPKKKTLLMGEWQEKLKRIVDEVITADVGSLSGVPSWMMVMIHAVLERTGASTLTEVWPNLEVFFHGGINFSPYRQSFAELIPSDRMQYMETYNASEGFFAIQDDPQIQAMLLMLDYGVFYEFVELDKLDETANPICAPEDIIPLWETEVGKNYAMLITTSGGLLRYLIGDTVRIEMDMPYRITITGRTKSYINAFGEELMVANADKALEYVCKMMHAKVREYTAAPCFFQDQQAQGRHDWLIEFDEPPADMARFAMELDGALQALNSDYEAKRYQDMTLLPLHITVAPDGLFHRWLDERGKLGGQHKVPRLSNNRKIIDELLGLMS